MARVIVLSCVMGSIACGPSLSQAHDRTEAYERCYAADYDPSVSVEARRNCWADWLENHSAGQPAKRITFAQDRLQALESEPNIRALPDDDAEPVRARVHDYPPAAPGEYHTSGCDPLCDAGWRDCTNHCDIRDQPCKAACESEFRICLSACP